MDLGKSWRLKMIGIYDRKKNVNFDGSGFNPMGYVVSSTLGGMLSHCIQGFLFACALGETPNPMSHIGPCR